MTARKKTPEVDEERELDVEPSQEYERFDEYDRLHRHEDERVYGDRAADEDEGDYVPDDPGEYEKG